MNSSLSIPLVDREQPQQPRRRPRYAIWEITNGCNLRCLHCEAESGKRHAGELNTDEALSLCDALASEGCEQCNVSGGEPLLRPDWDRICDQFRQRNVRVCLVTNGVCLDEAATTRALHAGVQSVAVSVDGLRGTHNRIRPATGNCPSTFDAAMAALDRVRSTSMIPAAITHINRWNFDQLEALHALLADHGVQLWQVQLGVPVGRQKRIDEPYMISLSQLQTLAGRLEQIINTGRSPRLKIVDNIGYYSKSEPTLRGSLSGKPRFWTGCHAGMQSVGIESQGNIKGCCILPPEFVAGNVRDRSFHDIWADESRFAYNTAWQPSRLTGYCSICAYRNLCRAGCTSLAYAVTGTIYENPYCLHRIERTGQGTSDEG
jgi:radical SAM protein with 4Fe4S-binding SPASM domain